MIKRGTLTVQRKDKNKLKSDVWDHIYSIKTTDGLVLKSFSQCQTCKTLLSATSSTHRWFIFFKNARDCITQSPIFKSENVSYYTENIHNSFAKHEKDFCWFVKNMLLVYHINIDLWYN